MRHLIATALALMLASPVFAQVGPNIDELAKELSNPGAANATLNFKLEYRTFDGDLPGADDQDSLTATFQPVFPFVLENGNNLIFRPAFSYVLDQPIASPTGFSDLSQFGDIPYDLLYSWNNNGWTFGAGLVGLIPTGSGISSDNWLLGPSALAVKTQDWGVWGFFPFHNEKVGGSGPDVSITSLQYFLFYGLGNGWQIGTGPTITYDWNADSDDAWTVPFGIQVAKTTAIGNQLIKLNAGIEKNVIAPDAFASDWKYTFTFSPVISNPFQPNPPSPPVDEVTRAAVLAPIR
ncbi:hypothetical protein [Tateyamaria sp.]|uniref:hypothetical protein n=1 Tax=Tateyamaria sp. TaxID=1929288 RepID=UPI00329BD4B0